jgi:hypothetical protein
MKRILFTIVCVLALSQVFSQGTSRFMVAVEDGTGTWCTYCPGAAMGCDDLLANGKYVAVIANHNGDIFANTYSNNRNSMWGINGYPTVTFDGWKGYVGGNHSSSLYNTYVPLYNACIAVTSPVVMEMVVTNTGGTNYEAVITLEKVDNITSTNNILYFFATQSHVAYNWQGQNHLEHINRLMVPGVNGTPVDFSTGNVKTVTLNFTLDAAWPAEDCEFIAFLQNKDAGQGIITNPVKKYVVYQTAKQGTIDLTVDFDQSADTVPLGGLVNFTNQTIGGFIGTPESYSWDFPGGTPSSSTDENPSIQYNTPGDYDVSLTVDRGGQIITMTLENGIHVNFAVGVNEQSGNQVTVSPNPSHGTFNLTFNVAKSFVADITLVNANGATVYSETGVTISNNMTKTIRTSGLTAGQYFLNIQNGDNKIVKKVVIN